MVALNFGKAAVFEKLKTIKKQITVVSHRLSDQEIFVNKKVILTILVSKLFVSKV